MYVFLNGKFLPAQDAHISITDHGFLYADGVYETLRTVHGKIFGMEEHFTRLERSAKTLQIHIPFSKQEIFTATQELLHKNQLATRIPNKNLKTQKIAPLPFIKGQKPLTPRRSLLTPSSVQARIRWTLTRGSNNYEFTTSQNPTFLITTTTLPEYPQEYFQKGIAITTSDIQRTLPQSKTISLLPMVLGKQKAAAENCFECLLLNNGYITEGTVSNFFALSQNTIWKAPTENILLGTAAKIFEQKAIDLGYRIQTKLFSPQQVLQNAQEAFLTNSIFGILPVTKLLSKNIATGVPGKLFQKIFSDFWNATH